MLDQDESDKKCYTEKLIEANKILIENSKDAAVEYLHTYLSEWEKQPVYIAITGKSGTGKSTFINKIRGVKATDPLAAKTGVNETTSEACGYEHPDNPNLVFYDLAGYGTPKFPADTSYVKKMNFQKYDAFLIFTSNRFYQDDHWIKEVLTEMGKPFFFVRTKIDQDIRNNRMEKEIEAEETVEEIRGSLEESLSATSDKEKENIYLLSSFYTLLYDYQRLVKNVIEALPSVKADAITFTLKNFSKNIIDLKMKALCKRSYLIATLSATFATPPIPGLSIATDVAFITTEFIHYQKQLDATALIKPPDAISEEVKSLTKLLKENVSSDLIVSILRGAVEGGANLAGEIAFEEVARIALPIIGSLISAGMSFGSTLYILQSRINKLGEAAKRYIDICTQEELNNLMNNA